MTRVVALWCPDWPVVAARRRGQAPEDGPVAVLEAGRVLAASREARAEEVGAGLRRREAEAASQLREVGRVLGNLRERAVGHDPQPGLDVAQE